jgi:hypothetical protein
MQIDESDEQKENADSPGTNCMNCSHLDDIEGAALRIA